MTAIDYDGLGRWGFKWKGSDHGTHVPMVDGYWTPWHEAVTAITALRGEVEALISDVLGDDALDRLRCKTIDTLRAELADRYARLAEAEDVNNELREKIGRLEQNQEDLTQVILSTNLSRDYLRTEFTDTKARLAEAEKVLTYYADTYCEGFGECVGDFCGKLSGDHCGGCPARAFLAKQEPSQ